MNLEKRVDMRGRTVEGRESDYRLELYNDAEHPGSAMLFIHDPRGMATGIRLEAMQRRELARALLADIEIGVGT